MDDGGERIVLLVEDDQKVREAAEALLIAAGYRVVGVADGREALERLRRGLVPGVILLDLRMPRMDGWQFRAEQRCDPALRRIPVVVWSADVDVAGAAGALAAEAWLAKPGEPGAILATVARLCAAVALPN
jgi:CheY-like chemotaxis protein